MLYAADDRPLPCIATSNLAEGGSQPYPPDGGTKLMQVGEVVGGRLRGRLGALGAALARYARNRRLSMPALIDAGTYR